MSTLKSQQEKLLVLEISRKTMEFIMGLDEKHALKMSKRVRKSSKKIVKLYTGAIKKQHKKAVRSSDEKKAKLLAWNEQQNGSLQVDEVIHTVMQ
ncbi:MAG: hypothetical protein QM791_23605 [Ferruginibacter sp.]